MFILRIYYVVVTTTYILYYIILVLYYTVQYIIWGLTGCPTSVIIVHNGGDVEVNELEAVQKTLDQIRAWSTFRARLKELCESRVSRDNVRLQRTAFVFHVGGEPYTATICRGDSLNK